MSSIVKVRYNFAFYADLFCVQNAGFASSRGEK